jgi:hypothetical protein
MESDHAVRLGRGFSIVLRAGLPLPEPSSEGGNLLTVNKGRRSLRTIEIFKFSVGEVGSPQKIKPRLIAEFILNLPKDSE